MSDNFEENISKFDDNKLCEIVVANRYLGTMREEAIRCMQELAIRRTNGSVFDYEKHIEQLIESLPKINLDLTKIMKMTKLL